MKTINIAISPCPNDTFIFEAIYNKKIDLLGFEFNFHFRDIQELNSGLFKHEFQVSKMSIAVLPDIAHNYVLLDSGAALGRGNGPLLIGSKFGEIDEFVPGPILIPGKNTTANLLLTHAFPQFIDREECLFSQISSNVASGIAPCGVIIHESRFTYMDLGLHKIADLGEIWEKNTNLPVPLGGIVASRSIGIDDILQIQKILYNSVCFALSNPQSSAEFVKSHAYETSDAVIEKHIALYVNEFSRSLNNLGRAAIQKLISLTPKGELLTLHDILLPWETQ